jgi:hypothetical protein
VRADPNEATAAAKGPAALAHGGAGLRREVKMIAEALAEADVLASLRLHPAGLRESFPPRVVQSLYLDSPFQTALTDNLAGISQRRKLRFRWYGDDCKQVRGILEEKLRRNQLGWKRRLPLTEPRRVEGAARTAFMRDLAHGLPPVWLECIAMGLEPVQWIAYTRRYFASADGALRATVDTALRACDQRHRAALTRKFETPLPQLLIVELKGAASCSQRLGELAGALPLLVDKCSKFVLASDPASGPGVSVLPT